jgi:hypothetical protein
LLNKLIDRCGMFLRNVTALNSAGKYKYFEGCCGRLQGNERTGRQSSKYLSTYTVSYYSTYCLNMSLMYMIKGKALPLQACSGPEGSRKLSFPDYMTTAQDGGKVVSLTHRPPYHQQMLLVFISVRGWVDPMAIVRSEGLRQWKIPMTPSGIESATFRFVAQYLNQCATISGPRCIRYNFKFIYSFL